MLAARWDQASPFYVVLLIIASVLAACADATSTPSAPAATSTESAAPTEASTESATPSEVAELQPIQVATNANANFTNLAIFYAVENGLFEERGYDAELVPVPDDTTGIRGLLANEFQILSQGVGAALAATSEGAPIVLVSSIAPHVDYQFVAVEGIESIEDLAGRTVGISSPGAISEQVPKLILANNGIDLSTINFVAIGGDADRVRALAAGQIDAAVVNTVNTVAALQTTPTLHVLLNAGVELSDDFLLTGVVTTRDIFESDPELVEASVSALVEASRILQTERDEAVDFGIEAGMPPDATGEAYDRLTEPDEPFFGVDGGLSQAAFESTVDSLIESGSLSEPLEWDDAVDTRFIDAALNEQGNYE